MTVRYWVSGPKSRELSVLLVPKYLGLVRIHSEERLSVQNQNMDRGRRQMKIVEANQHLKTQILMVSPLETRTLLSCQGVQRYYDLHFWLHTDLKRCDLRFVLALLFCGTVSSCPSCIFPFLKLLRSSDVSGQFRGWWHCHPNLFPPDPEWERYDTVQEDFQNIPFSFSCSCLFVQCM